MAIGTLVALAGSAGFAHAHPHVWVTARAELLFAPDGSITGIRHSWTFDDMYSSFAIQGLEKEGLPLAEALKSLAKINVTQLAEFGYFTNARAGGKPVEFASAKDQNITLDAKKNMTLHFTAVLKQPASAKSAFALRVYDPSYFVAFDLAKGTPVSLKDAPAGCSVNIIAPKPLDANDAKRLADVAGTNESPGIEFGIKLASRAIVACP